MPTLTLPIMMEQHRNQFFTAVRSYPSSRHCGSGIGLPNYKIDKDQSVVILPAYQPMVPLPIHEQGTFTITSLRHSHHKLQTRLSSQPIPPTSVTQLKT
eukprot:300001-Ditylum_brightwellii.AAC.1